MPRLYGDSKPSYSADVQEDGSLDVCVYHDIAAMRALLRDCESAGLLHHHPAYSRSNIRAQRYLAEVMTDSWTYFDRNQVRFILC